MPKFLAGLLAGALALCAGYAIASRNSTGTYSLITPGNPVVNGTTITPTWANNTLSDLSTEMTDSLSRSGKGGMLAPLRTTDGTVSSPAHSFTNEPGSGLYRIGASDYGFAIAGVKAHEWTGTGEALIGTSTQTAAGSATSIPWTLFQPSLANGNTVQMNLGVAAGTNQAAAWSFTPNATPALSTNCLGIFGVNSMLLCVDGNSKTTAAGALAVTGAATVTGATALPGGVTVGSTGTAITQIEVGQCTLNGASPATCTATVHSGAKCVASPISTLAPVVGANVSVVATTLTITSANANTNVVTYVCL